MSPAVVCCHGMAVGWGGEGMPVSAEFCESLAGRRERREIALCCPHLSRSSKNVMYGRGCHVVSECIEGEGKRVYEIRHVCDVVCVGCRACSLRCRILPV